MKAKKQRRPIRSFEIDEKADQLLKLAMESTGMTQTELFNGILHRFLEKYVKTMTKQRTDALKKFQAHWKNSNSH